MKVSIQNEIEHYRHWRKGVLVMSFVEILLLAFVSGLLLLTLYVCTKGTRGPSSIIALKKHLNDLQARFKSPMAINAENERIELEVLLNNVKTSCDKKQISGNTGLKELFEITCKQIKSITESKEVGSKSSWLKLKGVSSGFNEFYYS